MYLETVDNVTRTDGTFPDPEDQSQYEMRVAIQEAAWNEYQSKQQEN